MPDCHRRVTRRPSSGSERAVRNDGQASTRERPKSASTGTKVMNLMLSRGDSESEALPQPRHTDLRRRSEEVSALHTFIKRNIDCDFGRGHRSVLCARREKIEQVIGTQAHITTEGDKATHCTRRQSVRQLVQKICGGDSCLAGTLAVVRPLDDQRQLEGRAMPAAPTPEDLHGW